METRVKKNTDSLKVIWKDMSYIEVMDELIKQMLKRMWKVFFHKNRAADVKKI